MVEDSEWQADRETELQQVGEALQLAIAIVIIERLRRSKKGNPARIMAWLATDMAKIGRLTDTAKGMYARRMAKVFEQVAKDSDAWAAPFYRVRGIDNDGVLNDPFLRGKYDAGWAKEGNAVDELCRTDVMRLVTHDGKLMPIRDYYRHEVGDAIAAFGRAETDYNTLIDKVVQRLSKDGVQVMYKSGNTRELYAAVSMNLMDGFRLTMQDIRDEQAQQFGADGVEVSAHGMCAPDHLPYQGHQYSKAEFAEIQDGLSRKIAQGCNCRHMVNGIILGVSSKTYTPQQLSEIRRKSERGTGLKNQAGHELTGYEFTQWQRAQETAVRKLKAQAALFEKAGNKADARKLKEKAALLTDNYRKKSRAAKIETREERMEVYEWSL